MNIRKLLILFASFIFALSCKDSNNDIPPVNEPNMEAEKQIKGVIDAIGNNQELSTFKEALAQIDAKQLEGKEFTIIAYKNNTTPKSSSDDASTKATSTPQPSKKDETLRHIIGGKHTFDMLKQRKNVVALSKDTLYIKYDASDNTITLNGVALATPTTASNSIIFVADSIVPLAKDSIVSKNKVYSFEVMNINDDWLPDNNKDVSGVAKDAKVYIYRNDKLIKELPTDTAGIARLLYKEDAELNDLEYVVKTDTSSMLYNDYLVVGLYTSQEQLENAPTYNNGLKATVGGLIFADMNGDKIIDDKDKIQRAKLNTEASKQVVYLVGKSFEFPKEESATEDINIDKLYDLYDDTQELFNTIDLQHHSLEARQKITITNPQLEKVWNNSYNVIRLINILLNRDTLDNETSLELIGFRANLFFELSNLFGNVPLQLTNIFENTPRNSVAEVQQFVLESYDSIFEKLPIKSLYTSDEYINYLFVQRLQGKHNDVVNLVKRAIDSGTFALSANGTADSNVNVVRLYLLAAESANEVGNTPEAIQYLNILSNADNKAPSLTPGATKAEIREACRVYYTQKTNHFEGNQRIDYGIRYNNIVSWSQNSNWDKYKLLPLPISVIDVFTALTQNPGW